MPTGSKQADSSGSSVEASGVALRQGPWGGERSGRVASQPSSRSGNGTLKDPGAVMARHSWKVSRVHVLLPRQTQRGLRSGHGMRGAAKPSLKPGRRERSAPPAQTPPPAAAHPQIQLGAVQPEAPQPHGQVVDAERAVAVHVELLEQGPETPVLLGGLAQRPPAGPRVPPAASAAAALHRRSVRGSARAENAAHHRGGERAPRPRHRRTDTEHPSRPRHRQMAPLPPSRHAPSLPRDGPHRPITAGDTPWNTPPAPTRRGGS